MLADEPALQLVRSHHLADDQVVRAVVAALRRFTRERARFLQDDFMCTLWMRCEIDVTPGVMVGDAGGVLAVQLVRGLGERLVEMCRHDLQTTLHALLGQAAR